MNLRTFLTFSLISQEIMDLRFKKSANKGTDIYECVSLVEFNRMVMQV